MSDLLLDTQALLWFIWDDPQLSQLSRDLIEDPFRRKLVSLVSCWEIAIKASNRKLKLDVSASDFLEEELSKNNFELLPITFEHTTYIEKLPMHHRDPFDRLLIAQAIVENIPVVSSDEMFGEYAVQRLW